MRLIYFVAGKDKLGIKKEDCFLPERLHVSSCHSCQHKRFLLIPTQSQKCAPRDRRAQIKEEKRSFKQMT